jgi:hypothetical protein
VDFSAEIAVVVVVDDEDGWRLERFMNSDLFETCDGTNH